MKRFAKVFFIAVLSLLSAFSFAACAPTDGGTTGGGDSVSDYDFVEIDNRVLLTDYVGNKTKLSLPKSYYGKSYEIGDSAFKNLTITSVVIGDGVTKIGEDAFASCASLKSVTIGNNVTEISKNAFSWCGCLTDIVIPNSVSTIGDFVFYFCSSLKTVKIGNGVTSFGASVFLGCGALKKVEYTGNLDSWVQISFDGLPSNPLASADFLYVNGELVTSANLINALEISDYAFYDYSILASISIPDSVTSIGEKAFYNCEGLTSVIISKNVTSIGLWAFSNCSSLTSVSYNGTKAQWRAINKDYGWCSSVPATVVHCSDGDVAL